MYGIMVDEITDASNKEQLGLVLRYTIGVERLYKYTDFKNITRNEFIVKLSLNWNQHSFQYQIVELKCTMVLEIWLVNKETAWNLFSGLFPKHRFFTVRLMILTLRYQKLAILLIYSACY